MLTTRSAAIVFTLCIWASASGVLPCARAAVDLKVYHTSDNPGTARPHDYSEEWDALEEDGTIEVPAGGSLWIGCKNEHRSRNYKSFWLTIVGTNAGKDLEVQSAKGYENTTDKPTDGEEKWAGDGDDGLSIRWKFDPQPEWEVVELKNTGDEAVTVTVTATSSCYNRKYAIPVDKADLGLSYGAVGAMYGDPHITELTIFPINAQVDTDQEPEFDPPPGSGVWSHEFVYQDPEGNPRPQGGVRFYTDGRGVLTAEEHGLAFYMLTEADSEYLLFAYDAEDGEFTSYFLEAEASACPGDLDGDETTGQSDLGILLASWGIDDGGDLNGDGVTDQSDLGILLADWGCGT
ncbi:MAG: hypothetical protein KAX44_07465 [Candidatus Brocadiae bacterium]|nr:hypothetical protein [Candidatus Brocadiia bacterium]